ncbi:uncharacterized protein LOC113474147 [Ciona intestinalis]
MLVGVIKYTQYRKASKEDAEKKKLISRHQSNVPRYDRLAPTAPPCGETSRPRATFTTFFESSKPANSNTKETITTVPYRPMSSHEYASIKRRPMSEPNVGDVIYEEPIRTTITEDAIYLDLAEESSEQ